jgi:HAD superfamily hydrolase (TIGR01509 family)
MKIKAILFDLDGTLVKLKESHFNSFNMALKEIIGYEISLENHLKYFDGKTTKTKLNMLENLGLIKEEDKENIWKLKQEKTIECINMFHKDIEKINLLSTLKINNIKTACVSNSIRSTIFKILDKICISEYFDLILGNEDFVNKPKPDPYPYLLAFEMLNLKPEECLIVEDNFNGILSAKRSKAHLLEVQEVEDCNYENIINKINEIEGK